MNSIHSIPAYTDTAPKGTCQISPICLVHVNTSAVIISPLIATMLSHKWMDEGRMESQYDMVYVCSTHIDDVQT